MNGRAKKRGSGNLATSLLFLFCRNIIHVAINVLLESSENCLDWWSVLALTFDITIIYRYSAITDMRFALTFNENASHIIATVEWIWLLKYSIFHLPVVFSVDMFHHIEQSEQIDHHCIVERKNCPQIVDERYLCSILLSVIYFLFVRSVQESKFTLSIDSYRLLFQVLHISSVLCNWNWNLCTVQVCSINY